MKIELNMLNGALKEEQKQEMVKEQDVWASGNLSLKCLQLGAVAALYVTSKLIYLTGHHQAIHQRVLFT